MSRERWATFDCYGTLIDWNGGIRRELARVFGEERADERLERYHELEPSVQAGGARSYREVMTEAMRGLGAPEGRGGRAREPLCRVGAFPEVRGVLEEARSRGWKLAHPLEHRPRLHRGVDRADRRSLRARDRRVARSARTSRATGTGCSSSKRPALRVTSRARRAKPLPRHRSGERARPAVDLDQSLRRAARAAPDPRARRSVSRSPTHSMSSSLPDGFSVRPATREDASAINELVGRGRRSSSGLVRFDRGRPAGVVAARRPRAGLLGRGTGRPGRGVQRALRTCRERGARRLRPSREDGARARGVAACEWRGSCPGTRALGRTDVVSCSGRCRPAVVRAARLSRGAPVLPDVRSSLTGRHPSRRGPRDFASAPSSRTTLGLSTLH